jgi:hypothetical protein
MAKFASNTPRLNGVSPPPRTARGGGRLAIGPIRPHHQTACRRDVSSRRRPLGDRPDPPAQPVAAQIQVLVGDSDRFFDPRSSSAPEKVAVAFKM